MKKGPFKMKLNSPTKHNKRNQNIFKPDAKTVKPIDLHGDGSKNAGMGMLTPLGNFMPTSNRFKSSVRQGGAMSRFSFDKQTR